MINLSIISAESKREEYEIHQAQKELERIKHEMMTPQRIEALTEKIFNYAKEEIEKTKNYTSCSVTIHEWDFWRWEITYNEKEAKEAINLCGRLLEMAGYKVDDYYEYSESWQKRSGKLGFFVVKW